MACVGSNVESVRAVRFNYQPTKEVLQLLEMFRQMCNDAIHIAKKEKPRNRFDLITKAYQRLKKYGLHTHYIQNACEIAFSVYRNKNRRKDPYIRRAFLKLDNQTYRLDYLLLRIPIQPRNFAFITLQGSNYHLSYLADKSLKRGSITLTDSTVCISFSKETAEIEPLGQLGVDMNERNVTTSDTLRNTKIYDTSKVAEVKERYRAVRAKIAQRTQMDRRIQQKLLAKYGRREKNRTVRSLHRVSKEIVQHAKENRLCVVMEKLKGIRKLYRKGNGQGASYRGRMNSWTFREVQRQIEYKAEWLGIPVSYINARGTSSKCPKCGSSLIELEGRKLMCPSCRQIEDRDVVASKNIMAALVYAARPSKGSCEEESTTDRGNPQSRLVEVDSPLEESTEPLLRIPFTSILPDGCDPLQTSWLADIVGSPGLSEQPLRPYRYVIVSADSLAVDLSRHQAR